jgi:protein gp37
MSDLFGAWVPDEWIIKVLNATQDNPQHTYIFLTQDPERYIQFDKYFPENTWLGTTITGAKIGNWKRVVGIDMPKHAKRFLSIEPLLGEIDFIIPCYVDLVIVGAMTGNGAIKPKQEWIDSIKHETNNIYWKKSIKTGRR